MIKNTDLLQFPCQFPIKVMGKNSSSFIDDIQAILSAHFPEIQPNSIQKKESKEGKYISISVTVEAQEKEQLDKLYLEITGHSEVVMAL